MRVEATREGDRILLRVVGGYVSQLSKRVPGAYWRKTTKCWSLPLNTDTCRILRAEFGEDLAVMMPLGDWARKAFAAEAEMSKLGATLTGASLERIPTQYPLIAHALLSPPPVGRPYQAVAARFIADGRSVLVADTPGLGKTLEAIAGIVESGVPGPYLVTAPKTACEVVWAREIRHWLPDARVYVMPEGRAKRNAMLEDFAFGRKENAWVIINIEMMRTKSFWVCPTCGTEWKKSDHPKSAIIDCGHDPNRVNVRNDHEYPQLFANPWGAVIMDESHRSLIRTSGTPTQTRAGAKLLETRPDGLRIALSGTPMRGKPQQLFGTLNWLRPKEYGGYWAWVERFWDVSGGFGGSRVLGELRNDRKGILGHSLSGIMLRRTKREVSPELPEKDYPGTWLDPADPSSPRAVWLRMTPKQQKVYDEMLKMGTATVEGGQLNAIGGLAELTRLKQFATSFGKVETVMRQGLPHQKFTPALPSNKYDWLLQFLMDKDIIDPSDRPEGKVVVVSQFTSVLNMFKADLEREGVRSLMVTGEVTGQKRQQAVDEFNDMDSGVNVLFLNTTAGGVALTLDAADDMVLLDETHVWDDQEQVEDRINNRRPEEKVVTRRYWYLKSLGTVDEAIARVNQQMEMDGKALLDGRRGVAYVRAVFEEMKR